ncbi:hypothetical protein P5X00_36325 [Paraburkholderia sp. A2RO-4L]|uniref:hypothetical protein n=1 Tax=Paraburkholderia sp. A2RO-4L TaxID=3028374 RepID=UPI0032FA568A|nr:hypothetical protein [Burkholderia vietnamiensis]
MVSARKSRLVGYVTNPNPAQIVTLFLCGLGGLLLVSIGIGWLSDMLADTFCALCFALWAWLCKWVPEYLEASARHFSFFSGALGVTWASYIARRVQKARKNAPTLWDLVFFLLGLWVFGCYYADAKIILLDSAGFVYFLGLYSTLAVLAFCAMTIFMAIDAYSSPDNLTISFLFVFVAIVSAIMTGAVAQDVGSGTGASILLGFVHFVASGLGIVIAFWFCDVVEEMHE